MDNEEAKLILIAYRPGGEDASDPFFAAALEQARLDPELGRWLTEQRRLDQKIQSTLKVDMPPNGLRESLLLSQKVVHMERRGIRGMITSPVSWLGMAAVLALFLGVSLLFHPFGLFPTQMTEGQFVAAIHDMSDKGLISLGKMDSNIGELHSWLAAQGAPHDFSIPAKMNHLESLGCQSFIVNGVKVSLICYMLDKDRFVHLFVIDQGAIKNPPGESPSILHNDDRMMATWSNSGHIFLLTGTDLDEGILRRMI
jgi:hypothetical protein